MGRIVLAVIVAMIAALAVIMIVQMLNTLVAPPPTAEVINDPAKMRDFIANLPVQAFVVVLVGYFLGSFAGGFIVRNMSRRESPGMTLPILIGAILTVGGILNFFVMMPGQPVWFVILSLLTFIPVSMLGAKFAGR